MNEEKTLELIQELENSIKRYVNEEDNDELVCLIMYKVLLFSLNLKTYNETVLHNKCWEYFDKSKLKLMNTIP